MKSMENNRLQAIQELAPELKLIAKMGADLGSISKRSKRRIFGHLNLQTEREEGINIQMDIHPNGDMILWFIVADEYHLYFFRKGNVEEIIKMHIEHQEEFSKVLHRLSLTINEGGGTAPKALEDE